MALQVKANDERVNLIVFSDEDWKSIDQTQEKVGIEAPDVSTPEEFHRVGTFHYIDKETFDRIVIT